MKKFLIVKTSALGDIVQALPVVHDLKTRFPDCMIDWVVEAGPAVELLKSHPDISHVFEVRTRLWRKRALDPQSWGEVERFRRELRAASYDVLFDLQGNVKSGLINMIARAKHKVGLTLKQVSEWPNALSTNCRITVPVHATSRAIYRHLLQQYWGDPEPFSAGSGVKFRVTEAQQANVDAVPISDARLILVAPGSIWDNKQIPTAVLGEALCQLAQQHSYQFLLCHGNRLELALCQQLEEMLGDRAFCLKRLTLPELHAIMCKVDLVIAMDSLPLHLAELSGAATFAFFGPSEPAHYGPSGIKHGHWKGGCPFGMTFKTRCPRLRKCENAPCIKTITPNECFAALDHFIRVIYSPYAKTSMNKRILCVR